ncbi:SHOCT domain-containing protein [Epilithonimonas sp.]|uniref:SHOCT domain-containing protein n=1 Tax=Epilithonimonas sp. TaxID=2894511 RepID=UPI002896DCAC|nr:SHOCT domain-containing protein [Epilithonimonas sp.]
MKSNLSDLEKLAELKQKGILTEEEFQTKKSQILNQTNHQNIPPNNFQQSQTEPKKKKTGCLKIILITFGSFILMIIITAIFMPEDKNAKTKVANNDFLMSNKPKNQQQKIDSAKIANEKFQSLSSEEKIASLEKELENKNLKKVQKEEIQIEIKNIKQQEFAKKNISSWDGSNPKLERTVKKAMNDPDSYEHVQTTFEYKKDKVIGTMLYRGKNAFGGKIVDKAVGTFDYDGNLLEVRDAD